MIKLGQQFGRSQAVETAGFSRFSTRAPNDIKNVSVGHVPTPTTKLAQVVVLPPILNVSRFSASLAVPNIADSQSDKRPPAGQNTDLATFSPIECAKLPEQIISAGPHKSSA